VDGLFKDKEVLAPTLDFYRKACLNLADRNIWWIADRSYRQRLHTSTCRIIEVVVLNGDSGHSSDQIICVSIRHAFGLINPQKSIKLKVISLCCRLILANGHINL
jgi:hypothetical protein